MNRIFIKLICFILTCSTIISCAYDLDDNLVLPKNFQSADMIRTDTDLYKNLLEITDDTDRPDKTITCIDFIYPLTIFTFDENDELLQTFLVINDDQFSLLLENLELEHSISVSFPITSTLEDGEEFIVDSKEDLKEAIDNCLKEELLVECNNIIQHCVMKIGYSFNYENPYLGAFFQENNGLTTLTSVDASINGSWTVFYIEDELHININLIDNSEIGEFFNFDWKVLYIDENSLLLKNENRELVLNQRCDPEFATCQNFIFEECETTIASGISEFTLSNYTTCIFDTLELNEDFDISFFETEDDAIASSNPIQTEAPYVNTTNNQTIYVAIIDDINDDIYIIPIQLSAINCE